ncbi:MAG: hypothetical protein WDN28_23480 [Chthoniobacter sp.]
MIKTSDRKTATSPPESYAETSEPSLGITFEVQSGRKRFLPYPFLSALEYNGNELTFDFAADRIVAKGENLESLWRAACRGRLECVREIEKPAAGAPWVRELCFVNSESPEPLPRLPIDE